MIRIALLAALAAPCLASAQSEASGIFRVWTPRAGPPVEVLPLTAGAREAVLAYDALEDDPALRCIPPGMPAMLDTSHPIEFVDDGDRILMRFEAWDGLRTIHMNPRNRPAVQDPSPNGVSFGRWSGETLEIFTLYIDYPYFDAFGTPQSAAVTVFERYTPSADEPRLDWEVTVTDPATFTAPVVRTGFMDYEIGESIGPFACDWR